VQDRPTGRVPADIIDLKAIEGLNLIRRKPHEIEFMSWIWVRDREIWKFDFIEIAIFQAPKDVANTQRGIWVPRRGCCHGGVKSTGLISKSE
jgi:hypothetical protein